jgi:pyruvate dehydrogenase E1 component alpha subunit
MDLEQLQQAWRTMLRIRRFEERLAELVEAGEIRTPCHFCIGQEAIPAGVCAALEREDTIWGAHRSHGHYLAKGGDLNSLMAEVFCRRTGCSRGRGGSMHVCDPHAGVMGTVPIVAATIPVAVGAALAARIRGEGRMAVAFFGDGATEEGHFHESMNLAAVYRLPVLFVCENNLYSSHMGLLERRARDNIVASAEAHGLAGERIDGNDVEQVSLHAARAVERIRGGDGPTLLECRTFRWRGHVGPAWDLDVGVRRKDELQGWLTRDPIERTRRRLLSRGILQQDLDRCEQLILDEIDRATEFARSSSAPDEADINRHVFVNPEGRQRCA